MKNLKLDSSPADGGSPVPPTSVAPAVPESSTAASETQAQTVDVATNIANIAQQVIATAAPFVALGGPDAVAAIAIASGALAIYKAILPEIEALKAKGVITPDQQATIAAQFDDVANTHATAFQGAEWKKD